MVTTTFMATAHAQGAEKCAIRGDLDLYTNCYFKPCTTADRTLTVQYADGREFTLIGHNHGDRNWFNEIPLLILQVPFNKKALEARLTQIEQEDPTLFENAKDDVEFLKSYLTKKNEKVFVGVETVNSYLPEQAEALDMTREGLKANPNRMSKKLVDKSDRALLAIFGPSLYLDATKKELFKNAELKGFESEQAINEEMESDGLRAQMFEKLEKLTQNNMETHERLLSYQDEFITLNPKFDPEKDEDRILEKWRTDTGFLPKKKKLVLEWIKSEIDSLKTFYKRNQITTAGIIKDGRSGILLIGQAHVRSIAELLRKECLKQADVNRPEIRADLQSDPAGVR